MSSALFFVMYINFLPLPRPPFGASSFYTPVFRRDVLWYGDVRPGLRPTLRPVSVRPGLRPPVFRTFLLHALTYRAEILHMTLF